MYIVPDPLMGPLLTAIELAISTAITGLVHIHLFVNNITPTKTTILANFTELTNVEVPGYVAKSSNWFAGVPYRKMDGSWSDPNSLVDPSFVATGPPPAPQIVYGFFITDSTDAILLGSGLFLVPFTFVSTGDGFSLEGEPNLLQSDGNTLTLALQDLEPG